MLSVLDELINNEVLVQRARQTGVEATDGEVEDKFTEAKSPYTEDAFQRQLKDSGMTVDDLRRNIRQQVSVQKLINREIIAKIAPTDQDVTNFYNENRAQFNVRRGDLSPGADRGDADEGLRKFATARTMTPPATSRRAARPPLWCSSFATAPISARWPWTIPKTRTARSPAATWVSGRNRRFTDANMRRMLATMTPGQTSDVIRLPNGYTILRLVAKEAPGQRQLSDPQIQQTIRDTLRGRKEQLMRAAYLLSARDQSRVVNYLARQVLESAGKLPEIKIQPPAAAAPGATARRRPRRPQRPRPSRAEPARRDQTVARQSAAGWKPALR